MKVLPVMLKISDECTFPKDDMPNPFYNAIQSYVRFVKSGKEEPAVWLADHHDNGTAYTVASYTKGELFLVELGYIVGEENLSKIFEKILPRLEP